MDEEIKTINTNTKIEKLRSFFINNKKTLISIAVFIILSLFGYFFYKDYLKKKKVELADKYNLALLQFNSADKTKVTSQLKEIVLKKDRTYSPLALYFIIDNSLIESNDEINKLFDVIIDEVKNDKELKNLIIYKKGLYNSEYEQEDKLLAILNPVINSDSAWKSHSLFLMAEYFYANKEMKKSKEFYEKIINLKNVNQDIFLEAQKRIQRDFSE